MIELINVTASYQKGIDVLKDITLSINDGDFAFIVGSSGSGKSTLIKLLLKEIDADSGTIIVNDFYLNRLTPKKVPMFRRTIGVVFQDFRLIPNMTVYDNVAFVLRVTNKPAKYITRRVPYVLHLVGLQDKMKSYPNELSGGEQQRVAIARALANEPKLIIADEPTGNVDPDMSYEIVEMLKNINSCGTTILMVTHEHDIVRYFGGRVINIDDGIIIFDDYVDADSDVQKSKIVINDNDLEFTNAFDVQGVQYDFK